MMNIIRTTVLLAALIFSTFTFAQEQPSCPQISSNQAELQLRSQKFIPLKNIHMITDKGIIAKFFIEHTKMVREKFGIHLNIPYEIISKADVLEFWNNDANQDKTLIIVHSNKCLLGTSGIDSSILFEILEKIPDLKLIIYKAEY